VVVDVAVVARLVFLKDAVAATRPVAIVRAIVPLEIVAVVTFLGGLLDPVATARESTATHRRAWRRAQGGIGAVALFAVVDDAVAAGRRRLLLARNPNETTTPIAARRAIAARLRSLFENRPIQNLLRP
jgi:hypothetical protein